MGDQALMVCGGAVYDGVSAAPRVADVLVRNGDVEAIGPDLAVPADAAIVDATGKAVLPGFVDVHSHDDVALFRTDGLDPKLRQGVTTTVIGNCGHGVAPSTPTADLSAYSAPILGTLAEPRHWPEFTDFLASVDAAPRSINAAALVPHGPLRARALGVDRRAASESEVARMCGWLDDALAAGALGLSLGLMYPPGNSADAAELRALAAVVARRGKLLVAHIRNEGDRIRDALEEFVALGRTTGAALHLSHLKVTGPTNHGRMAELVATLDDCRAAGVDITADVYPYAAGSTTAATLLPPWTADGGLDSLVRALGEPSSRRRILDDLDRDWPDLENYFRSLGPDRIRLMSFSQPENAPLEGRTLAEISTLTGDRPEVCLLDLLRAEHGGLSVVLFQMCEPDIHTALAWRWTMLGSDGLPLERGSVHPRLYGTFPRLFGRYVGEVPGLDVAEAVRRTSALPVARFGLGRRGAVLPGHAADLVVVNLDRFADTATYDDPRRFPTGVELVVVNGYRAAPG